MPIYWKLGTREIALVVCFTALYVVLAFLPMFPIIGSYGRNITAAAIIAPIIGVLLGPYLGTLSTSLGGIVCLFFNPYFVPSLAAGIVTSLCAGLLYAGKRAPSAIVYSILLLSFAFFPSIGPSWLYPPMVWFQVVGLILLVSPLQSAAIKNISSNFTSKFVFSFFIISLMSSLAGQIAGSLTYESIVTSDINVWKGMWTVLTAVYPVERTLIALLSGLIGAPLHKVLKSANLLPILNWTRHQEMRS